MKGIVLDNTGIHKWEKALWTLQRTMSFLSYKHKALHNLVKIAHTSSTRGHGYKELT